jgi:hypothetical protein
MNGCLKDYETATYDIADKQKRPGRVKITITDTRGAEPARSIDIGLLNPSHYYPIELHECHFYLAQVENYDYEKSEPLPGYKAVISGYNYLGSSREVVILADSPDGKRETAGRYYGTDFRVSFDERFIVLEQSYSETPDYALVIKNIESGEDVFVLPMSAVMEGNPKRNGVFNLHGWTKDSSYFWTGTSETAYVKSYIRVDTRDWSYEIFDAPEGALGGSPLNLENGWVPINPGGQWTGSYEMDQILTKDLKEQGYTNPLLLYNLFTEEDILLAETPDTPMFWYEPEWLSDTELQYTMPDGTKRSYTMR